MKKVLIAQDLRSLLEQHRSFLDRTDVKSFVAATNDEMLNIHRAERVDLIMTKLDLSGTSTEKIFSLIREDAVLRTVAVIMCCVNTTEAIRKCSQCRVNAVLLAPLHPVLLMAKAQQLLDIASRETLRVLLSVAIDGRCGDEPFYGRTKNISVTGMMIETKKRLVEGARLTCQFYLTDAKKIQVSGNVVRIIQQTSGAEDHQYGLMFTDIAPEIKQLLADFVESSRH